MDYIQGSFSLGEDFGFSFEVTFGHTGPQVFIIPDFDIYDFVFSWCRLIQKRASDAIDLKCSFIFRKMRLKYLHRIFIAPGVSQNHFPKKQLIQNTFQ